MENEQATIPVSRHMKVGVVTMGVAGGCMVAVLLLGWSWGCFVSLLILVVLLYGWISVLEGLFVESNRQGFRLWKHIALLLLIPAMLYMGNYFSLLDLRMRLAVAFTGGKDDLQAWAVALLDGPRDALTLNGSEQWSVPPKCWSKQVRRLKPHGVRIEPMFENGQEGVILPYGGGFLHWQIVVGPPDSRPDRNPTGPPRDNFWFRWADGIYNCYD